MKTNQKGSLSLESGEFGPTLGGRGDSLEVSEQLSDMKSEVDRCV